MTALGRVLIPWPLASRRAFHLLERNALVYRRTWLVLVSGVFEPLFYLTGIGFGVGSLVGGVPGSDGTILPYAVFVAPALMASASMNGVIAEVTFNLFFKLRIARTYDAVLATPMMPGDLAVGELVWAIIRGGLYAVGFIAVMGVLGLIVSPWAVLAVPGALLIAFAFGAVGMAATTYLRTFADFDLIFVIVTPLFLFSATFFPLSMYPTPLQLVVWFSPLYHGVDLLRSLTTGHVGPELFVHVGYLASMGILGLLATAHRLDRLLVR